MKHVSLLFLYANFLYATAEMEMYMLGSILLTKCMVLESIDSRMVICTKGHGMKEEDRDWECILFEVGKQNLVIGKMGFFMIQKRKTVIRMSLHALSTMPRF